MKNLRDGVENYLALRRGLGFKLKRHGRFVREFAAALEKRDKTQITTQLVIEWATEPQHLHPSEWAARLSSVRSFARYWSAIDAATEIPPDGLLPFHPRRANPYLYSDEEIQQLLDAARRMLVHFSLHRLTYHCLLGLLAVTGLRISEALNLELRDVDWMEALLTIRSSKFGKSRLVPLHPTTKEVLADYASQRNQCFPTTPLRCSFHLIPVPASTKARLGGSSTVYRGRLAFGDPRQVVDPACTIFDIALPLRLCSDGIAVEKTYRDACQFSPPTSDTPTLQIRTGI